MKRLAVFLLLFAFWLIFSGHFDALHLSLGFVCCALVTTWSGDLLFAGGLSLRTLVKVGRFVRFTPWLLYQIVLANLHVVYLIFRPDHLRPQVVRFKTRLTSDFAKVTLGNAITLTPGTITMDIVDGEFVVHAVSNKVAASLQNGEMELRVAWALLEDDNPGVTDDPPARPGEKAPR